MTERRITPRRKRAEPPPRDYGTSKRKPLCGEERTTFGQLPIDAPFHLARSGVANVTWRKVRWDLAWPNGVPGTMLAGLSQHFSSDYPVYWSPPGV